MVVDTPKPNSGFERTNLVCVPLLDISYTFNDGSLFCLVRPRKITFHIKVYVYVNIY